MLKLYVGAKLRFQDTADGFVNKLGELRNKDYAQDGFASAEMIGLSVVGVLIAFAIYAAFDKFIGGDDNPIGKWLDSVLQRDS